MKRTITICATAALVFSASVPVSAIPFTAQPSSASTAFAKAKSPVQAFASAQDIAAPAVARDSFSIEEIVPEVVVVASDSSSYSTYSGGYGGEFAGFLSVFPAGGGVNDGFGYRDGGEFHGGIDIMAGYGGTIVAAAPGVVSKVVYDDGWGQYVMIDHGSGVSTLYAHMIAGSPTVSAGQVVNAGDMIGQVGDTGYVTVAHLHFETWIDGTRVDPYLLLP